MVRFFKSRKILSLVFLMLCAALCGGVWWTNATNTTPAPFAWFVARRVPIDNRVRAQIVQGAKRQIGTIYNASYQPIAYPNGDVSSTRNGRKQGACSDVVIRALRFAKLDLQRLMHEDMTRHFALYPQLWDLKAPNANIDHRRVPNQMTFFARFGQALPTEFNSSTRKLWQPGDIVCWDTGNGRTHTGIVSDGVDQNDTPLVIHNNSVCREDDCLQHWPIIGHFRFPR